MRLIAIFALAVGLGLGLLGLGLNAQFGRRGQHEQDKDEMRLPDGKSQKIEILKAEHKKSKEDAAELLTLAQELKEEVDKDPYQVVNLRLIKKAEDIEKLARNIKNRMKRY
jgi:hypothetical protein